MCFFIFLLFALLLYVLLNPLFLTFSSFRLLHLNLFRRRSPGFRVSSLFPSIFSSSFLLFAFNTCFELFDIRRRVLVAGARFEKYFCSKLSIITDFKLGSVHVSALSFDFETNLRNLMLFGFSFSFPLNGLKRFRKPSFFSACSFVLLSLVINWQT